ncbi:MAG: AraC family transcriptional regulator [Clostridia bacterium]|nr:AraC family transcriptional regulator [Clostridia bacterium]
MINDYISQTDQLFFKHEISEDLPCNTYSMHTHNTYELIYFLEGNATHVIEDRKYKLKKGDLILIRPFSYHFIQIDAPAKYERYDILFDAEKHRVESVSQLPESLEVVNLSGNTVAEDIFRRCDLYYRTCPPETFTSILSHLLSELFYAIQLFPQTASQESDSLSPLISKALQYTNKHLCTISGIEEIANHLFVSESYLFRLFQRELHQTPRRYIMEKRLLLAQKMLSLGEKPTIVCEKCGFCDYTTFYRNYTEFFGHAPSGRTKT